MDLITDSRLSARARIVGLYIQRLAPPTGDPVEIPHKQLAQLFYGGSKRTIGEALEGLDTFDYIERTPGGRGHADLFRATENVGLSDSTTESVGLKPLSPTENVVLSVRSSRGVVVDVEERAREALGSEKLKGCRGALSDYLTERVPLERQYGYVQTLITWIDGGADASVFRMSDGGQYKKSQTRLMAEALNELLGSDEGQMARPLGDVANLKTKLNILIRSGETHERIPAGRSDTRGPSTKNGRGTPASRSRADGRPDAKWAPPVT